MIMTICSIGYGQSDDIEIRYTGNCGLHITDGYNDLYIDFPYKSGAHNYVEYDESEIDRLKKTRFIFSLINIPTTTPGNS